MTKEYTIGLCVIITSSKKLSDEELESIAWRIVRNQDLPEGVVVVTDMQYSGHSIRQEKEEPLMEDGR